nr:protein unusual floral organs [Tanacetum cinerariifolium]
MEAFDHTHYVTTFPFSYPFPTTTATITTNPQWMDTRIWSRLPQKLIDRVIAFLPPPAFFRARSVCKRWYSLLFSHNFLQMYLQINSEPYFFIFFKQKPAKTTTTTNVFKTSNPVANAINVVPQEGYAFDPETLTWHRLVFPLIPQGFSPTCSSGGLVCWVSDEAGSKGMMLSNPLFPSLVTPLPSTLRPRLYPSAGLAITNSSIDVMVAGDDLISPYAVKNLTTESFHIDVGGFYSIWGTTSCLPRLCSLESGKMVYVQQNKVSSGKFYCMNYSPFSVLGYDMARNEWCKIQAPMRRFLRSPSLVESKGKLLLIAAVEKSKLNVPKSLRMWGLQDCGTTWVEVERMPQQLYAQFAELENGRGFTCVGNGEYVVVMIMGTAAEKALLFDFGRKRWVWIPPCPYVGVGGELNGFAYEPRLATPVTALLDQLTTINPF